MLLNNSGRLSLPTSHLSHSPSQPGLSDVFCPMTTQPYHQKSSPAHHDSQSCSPIQLAWQSPRMTHPASDHHTSSSHCSPASPAVSFHAPKPAEYRHSHTHYSPVGSPSCFSTTSRGQHVHSHSSSEYRSLSHPSRLSHCYFPVSYPYSLLE